jgi:hypothetical protein
MESGAFVIIEYKKDRNFSVVDQGVAYLNLMPNNKADFILEYNERSSLEMLFTSYLMRYMEHMLFSLV